MSYLGYEDVHCSLPDHVSSSRHACERRGPSQSHSIGQVGNMIGCPAPPEATAYSIYYVEGKVLRWVCSIWCTEYKSVTLRPLRSPVHYISHQNTFLDIFIIKAFPSSHFTYIRGGGGGGVFNYLTMYGLDSHETIGNHGCLVVYTCHRRGRWEELISRL